MNHLVQRQMIIWTFVLVTGLGLLVTTIMLQPPEKARSAARKVASLSRVPAAAAQVQPEIGISPETPNAVDLQVPCDTMPKPTYEQGVRQVRLTGDLCSKAAKVKLQTTEVRNATNGFVATVFSPNGTTFTTDYISLNDGENRIVLQMSFENGTKETRDLVIQRQPAATKP